MLDFGALVSSSCRSFVLRYLHRHVSSAAAIETGLSQNTLVVAGAIDQVCGALACGNIAPEWSAQVQGRAGTVGYHCRPILNENSRIPCHIHAIPNSIAYSHGIHRACVQVVYGHGCQFCFHVEFGLPGLDLRTIEQRGQSVPPGSDGLVMLPHLAGALFPNTIRLHGRIFRDHAGAHAGHFVLPSWKRLRS